MPQLTILCPACRTPHRFDTQLSFRAECEKCAADLHVCLTCRFHDRYVENECREVTADPVAVKDRRNLCEYWKPKDLENKGASAADEAKAKLDALFGGKAPAPPAGPSAAGGADAAADDAKAKLEALFKKKSS